MKQLEPYIVAKVDDLTHEEWLNMRKDAVGASEMAGIMGYSPWQTALSLYVEKVEGGMNREESLAMELGKELEPFLRRKFVQWLETNEGVEGEVVFSDKVILRHPEHEVIRCSPDDLFIHPTKGLSGVEYKTASEFAKDQWSDTDVPDAYYIQCQGCMAVTGLSEWYLAYLIGNRKFDCLLVPRNEEVINSIIIECLSFWNNFVIPKTAPAPTGAAIDTKALKTIYPTGEGTIDLPELEGSYDQLKTYTAEQKALDEKIQAIKNEIMAEMGSSEVAVFGEKENGKPKRAVWKMTDPVEVKAYTRKGSRVFRTY